MGRHRATTLHDPVVRTAKGQAAFYDFDEFERVVIAAQRLGTTAQLVVLLGGEAGLRCGEMMALEWGDVDLKKRQLCVARSDWKGHVTVPKGGRLRYVLSITRLAGGIAASTEPSKCAVRPEGQSTDAEGGSGHHAPGSVQREGEVGSAHPATHLLFALGDAGCAGQGYELERGIANLDALLNAVATTGNAAPA